MKYIKQFIVCSIFTLCSGYLFASEISEEQVKSVIAQMDAAIEAKNVAGVAGTLAAGINIRMNIHANGNLLQTLKMNKREYISLLNQGWAAASSYSYVRNNEKVSIADGVATVSAEVVEVATIQGQTIKTTTKEIATIELVDDVPLITKITGDAHM